MLKFALVLAFVVLATAQINSVPETVADGSPLCNKKGFQRHDKSKYYKAGAGVTTAMCARQYLDVCYTVNGVVPCNKDYEKCVDVNTEWNDANLNPVSAKRMADRPQVCASEGALWHTETAAVAVAVPVISFICFVIAAVWVVGAATRAEVALLPKIVAICNIITCTFLLFSFWYLNAILAITAGYFALGMIASKDKGGIATAIVGLVATLFWLTQGYGLGYLQHHSRYNAMPDYTSYVSICNNYYRGYFGWPIELHGPFESPSYLTTGYCLREWIAAELFWLILTEAHLVILVAHCAKALRPAEEPAQPVAEQPAPEAATN